MEQFISKNWIFITKGFISMRLCGYFILRLSFTPPEFYIV